MNDAASASTRESAADSAAPSVARGAPPRVSIVLPTCDRRDQTRQCVESLLAQTFDDFEIVLVDDGSADGTAQAIEALAATRPDRVVRVLRNERNLGANASRNRGVEAAQGSLVAFLDSDCLADPHWLSNLVGVFDDPSIGAASGLVEDVCSSNLWELAFRGTHRLPRRGDASRFTSCNLCVRRELLDGHAWEEDFSNAAVTGEGRADTSFSGRCDEEGLYLAIRAAGWRVVAEPSAKLEHRHPYSARSLVRQAYHGGRAAAELVWKFRLRDRLDVAPFIVALAALLVSAPLALLLPFPWSPWILLLPLPPLAAGCAAVAWNETANKGKSIGELVQAAPVLALYYALRTCGYLSRRIGLWAGIDPVSRVSKGSLGTGMPQPSRGGAR
jgi:glycosyltransferase involved in cell wall biosynthesis